MNTVTPKDKALSDTPTGELRLLLDKLLGRQFDTAIKRVNSELRNREKRRRSPRQEPRTREMVGRLSYTLLWPARAIARFIKKA